MHFNTRRRVLGLLAAAFGTQLLPSVPRIRAQEQCFAMQRFGQWRGVATHLQAGARTSEISFEDEENCDLRAEMQVAASLDGKLVLYGDPLGTQLPKSFLVNRDNRLIVRKEDGSTAVDAPLCGVCTDIRDDKVSIVLPLALAPLFRESRSIEMAVKLGEKDECRFSVNCEELRLALNWAEKRQSELAEAAEADTCKPPQQGCFLTTACCEVLGLSDDCFELVSLRGYRDRVLATSPSGQADIAWYYRTAPAVLDRLYRQRHEARLLSLYWLFILPSAIAARLGFNRVTHALYRQMMRSLAREFEFESQ